MTIENRWRVVLWDMEGGKVLDIIETTTLHIALNMVKQIIMTNGVRFITMQHEEVVL